MNFVVFGLTVSSSWGNGHATLWRGLGRALGELGHRLTFFERDVPYYAAHRDLTELPDQKLHLYENWTDIAAEARHHLAHADVAMVTSYCPDALAACEEVLGSRASVKAFYDLDTPVTLERLRRGEEVAYLPPGGLGDFDLVLSYTGGHALEELQTRLGARRVAPLYGSVDPAVHHPVPPQPRFAADLSYLGTYADDRQDKLTALLLDPARQRSGNRFLIGGSMYPSSFTWMPNISYIEHLAPEDHAAFYGSSSWTLSVTREPMAAMGWCPSGRLFEAAACGAPIITDWWDGLDAFFEPGLEVLVARDTRDVLVALDLDDAERQRIASLGRQRTLDCHTAMHRARDLEAALAPVVATTCGSSADASVA